jgi:hypothetical protein
MQSINTLAAPRATDWILNRIRQNFPENEMNSDQYS